MMDLDHRALDALAGASLRMGSAGKRFRNELLERREADAAYHLTDRQREYLFLLCWTYRRQIRDSDVLHLAGSYHQRQSDRAAPSPVAPPEPETSPQTPSPQGNFWP